MPSLENRISGYAAVFSQPTDIGGRFREQVARGAFRKSIRENDVICLLDHDSGRILGRKSAGTLQLREDPHGLHFILDANPSTPDGQTAIGAVGRRDLKAMSFGFIVRAERWDHPDDDPLPLRTLEEIDIIECSIVSLPAYEGTSAEIVGHDPMAASRARAKAKMRARGLTPTAAKRDRRAWLAAAEARLEAAEARIHADLDAGWI